MQLTKRHTYLLILFAVIAAMYSVRATAQDKTGYIDLQLLLRSMPEAKQAYASLQQYEKSLNSQGQLLLDDYTKKLRALNKPVQPLSDSVKLSLMQEIAAAQERMEHYQEEVTEKVSQKEQELTAPLVEKAQQAIQAVANEQGYTTVLNNVREVLLVKPAGDDLLPAVRRKLGIAATAVTPKAAPKPASKAAPTAPKAKGGR
ncbi:OmpH family outer membrane protein [Chitinophaga pendula]|uniref:OmpH family outer membrane protein n=1 Tax=Chitinophaga pendula TaxID=2849666 RepID=UPI001CEC6A21|nr:OmpH family outer membrane protein [Chitinophaga pendula]UCJ05087.1 OmpH family outer membrane protein [Chitinophaga pendula]